MDDIRPCLFWDHLYMDPDMKKEPDESGSRHQDSWDPCLASHRFLLLISLENMSIKYMYISTRFVTLY